jgi:hypothetical protein
VTDFFRNKNRHGWRSRCKVCHHQNNKAREKAKRAGRVALKLELRFNRLQRKKLKTLERRLVAVQPDVRLCKYCGEKFISSGRKTLRICETCLPLRGLSGPNKFRVLVKQLVEMEDDALGAKLLNIYHRTMRTSISSATGKIIVPARYYIAKLIEQSYRCAICKQKPNGRLLSVDHDHNSNRLRGLLCDRCNLGLGSFNDSSISLEAATGYLKGYST